MTSPNLHPKEKKFLARQIRSRRAYLVFCWVGLAAAFLLILIHAYTSSLDGKTGVLILLILLQSRSNLKQYKDAGLLEKLARFAGVPAGNGDCVRVDEWPRD